MMGRVSVVGMAGVIIMSGCVTAGPHGRVGGVEVVAHRGASAYAPENTLAAFRLAHEMGADFFELDCTLTRDGEIIVIHDDTLERTTGVRGAVADWTLGEIKRLEAGSWKDSRFAGEPLPTLDEALRFARNRIKVYIEIKNSDDDGALYGELEGLVGEGEALLPKYRDAMMACIEGSGTRNLELTRGVIALVRKRRMKRQVVIQSFSPVVCAISLAEAPELRTEFLGAWSEDKPERREDYMRWSRLLGAHGQNVSYRCVTPELLAQWRAEGKTVAVWTVNEPEDMKRMVDWGVTALITDKPDVCLGVLREMGKR